MFERQTGKASGDVMQWPNLRDQIAVLQLANIAHVVKTLYTAAAPHETARR